MDNGGLIGVEYAGMCEFCKEPIILYSYKMADELKARGLLRVYTYNFEYNLVHIKCYEDDQVARRVATRING